MVFKKEGIIYQVSFDESSNLFIAQNVYKKDHFAFGTTIEKACENLLSQ